MDKAKAYRKEIKDTKPTTKTVVVATTKFTIVERIKQFFKR